MWNFVLRGLTHGGHGSMVANRQKPLADSTKVQHLSVDLHHLRMRSVHDTGGIRMSEGGSSKNSRTPRQSCHQPQRSFRRSADTGLGRWMATSPQQTQLVRLQRSGIASDARNKGFYDYYPIIIITEYQCYFYLFLNAQSFFSLFFVNSHNEIAYVQQNVVYKRNWGSKTNHLKKVLKKDDK